MTEQTDDHKPRFQVIDGDHAREDDAADATDELDAVNDEAVLMKIHGLEQEHRDLDQAIHTMEERMPYDRLTLQRMKKRKLGLKDKIRELRGTVTPDIIA